MKPKTSPCTVTLRYNAVVGRQVDLTAVQARRVIYEGTLTVITKVVFNNNKLYTPTSHNLVILCSSLLQFVFLLVDQMNLTLICLSYTI